MAPSPRFLQLVDQLKELHLHKNAGYSGADNPDPWDNFREAEDFGVTPLKGCLVRASDKWRRLKNLLRGSGKDEVGETLTDTLMDMAAYCLIAVCLLEEEHAPQAQ